MKTNGKRLLSLLLAVSMIAGMVMVPGVMPAVSAADSAGLDIPSQDYLYVDNDFEMKDGVVDMSGLQLNQDAGSTDVAEVIAEQSNYYLYLEKNDAADPQIIRTLTADEITPYLVVEAKLASTNLSGAALKLTGTTETVTFVEVDAEGKITSCGVDTGKTMAPDGKFVTVTVSVDAVSNAYSLWIDGVQVVSNAAIAVDAFGSVTAMSIDFTGENTDAANLMVDDVKIYRYSPVIYYNDFDENLDGIELITSGGFNYSGLVTDGEGDGVFRILSKTTSTTDKYRKVAYWNKGEENEAVRPLPDQFVFSFDFETTALPNLHLYLYDEDGTGLNLLWLKGNSSTFKGYYNNGTSNTYVDKHVTVSTDEQKNIHHIDLVFNMVTRKYSYILDGAAVISDKQIPDYNKDFGTPSYMYIGSNWLSAEVGEYLDMDNLLVYEGSSVRTFTEDELASDAIPTAAQSYVDASFEESGASGFGMNANAEANKAEAPLVNRYLHLERTSQIANSNNYGVLRYSFPSSNYPSCVVMSMDVEANADTMFRVYFNHNSNGLTARFENGVVWLGSRETQIKVVEGRYANLTVALDWATKTYYVWYDGQYVGSSTNTFNNWGEIRWAQLQMYTREDGNVNTVKVDNLKIYSCAAEKLLPEYTVTWDVDGVKTTEQYKKGETPVFTGSTDKATVGHTVYTFTGWDVEPAAVTGDVTYTAQYSTTTTDCEDKTNDHNCDVCGKENITEHQWDAQTGKCTICQNDCDHDWSNKDGVCAVCGAQCAGHTGGTATCKELAVCTNCGASYGEFAAHNYVNDFCTECGAEDPSAPKVYLSQNFEENNNGLSLLGGGQFAREQDENGNYYLKVYAPSAGARMIWNYNSTIATSNDVLYSFDLAITAAGGVHASISGSVFVYVNENSNEIIANVGSTGYSVGTISADGTFVHIDIVLDAENDTYSLWIDGVAIARATNVAVPKNEIAKAGEFRIEAQTAEMTFLVDNVVIADYQFVTWVVGDKTVVLPYAYRTIPAFTGSTDKAADGHTVYTFSGWDKEIVAVTGDVTYTAQYTESTSEHEWSEGVCGICGSTHEHDEADFVREEKEATCTEDGYIKQTCGVCGKQISYSEIPAHHEWDAATGECKNCDAVCEHGMWVEGNCSYCGMACSHSGGEATCLVPAICETCGIAYGDVGDHNYTGAVTIQPTLNSTGEMTYTCGTCGHSYTEVMEALSGAVAEISGYKYATLEDAILNAQEGDVIVMLTKLSIAAGEVKILDLTGKTIIIAQTSDYGMVINGDLTIEGGTFIVSGLYGIGVNGTLTINGGNFGYNADCDYLIGNWGTTVINGGTFNGQYNCVNNFAGTTVINDGSFTTAEYDYTGEYESLDVYADAGLTVKGGKFSKPLDETYCEEGFLPVENADGTYGVGVASYIVTWIVDGKETTETYTAGEMPTFKGSTDIANSETHYYTFTGWDKKIEAVTGDVTYTAQYKETALIKFSGATVVAGNNLDMKFALNSNLLSDWTGHKVVIKRTYGDGRADDITTIPVEELGMQDNFYAVPYTKLAAKMMSDKITLTVVNAAGQTISKPWVDSMRDYAMRALNGNKTDLEKRLYVDMLYYGAEAQLHFGYDVNNLATAELTEEHKSYASGDATYTESLDRGDKILGSQLVLESNISLRLAFKNMKKDMYATVEYTDNYGNAQKLEYAPEDINWTMGPGAVFIETLVLADARQEITVKVYNGDGSLYTECHESIENYLARSGNVAGVEAAIMRFADSAYAFLHRNDGK